MNWLNRKKRELRRIADTAPEAPALVADTIPADVREAIEKALAPYPLKYVSNARFFGVPMDHFTKDELIRIVSWVGENSRDHRRDS